MTPPTGSLYAPRKTLPFTNTVHGKHCRLSGIKCNINAVSSQVAHCVSSTTHPAELISCWIMSKHCRSRAVAIARSFNRCLTGIYVAREHSSVHTDQLNWPFSVGSLKFVFVFFRWPIAYDVSLEGLPSEGFTPSLDDELEDLDEELGEDTLEPDQSWRDELVVLWDSCSATGWVSLIK